MKLAKDHLPSPTGSLFKMRNIKLIIEYDGTDYCGWQVQPELRTIQGVIQSSLSTITKAETGIIGAGRTDSGVHALCQVANFNTESRMKPGEFKAALNSLLPKDIVVRHVEEVDENFHARYSAIKRAYRYIIINGTTPSAFLHRYAYLVHEPIQVEKMAEAYQYLIGTYDFSSFASGSDPVKTYTRTIFDVRIVKEHPLSYFPLFYLNNILNTEINMIYFYIEANAFLRGMVRAIVGTLLEVGKGKMPPERIKDILDAKDRSAAGPSLPARGLCLVNVEYASDSNVR